MDSKQNVNNTNIIEERVPARCKTCYTGNVLVVSPTSGMFNRWKVRIYERPKSCLVMIENPHYPLDWRHAYRTTIRGNMLMAFDALIALLEDWYNVPFDDGERAVIKLESNVCGETYEFRGRIRHDEDAVIFWVDYSGMSLD